MDQELRLAMGQPKVGYSVVWEDHSILAEGLAIAPNDRVLSIGSAGCNVLNLSLQGAKQIDVIDINPAQLALIDLKLNAIRTVSHEDFLDLLLTPRALDVYQKIRPYLKFSTIDFFARSETILVNGIMFSGRLEQAFMKFRENVLPLFWPTDVIHSLKNSKDLEEQKSIVSKTNLQGLGSAIETAFGRKALSEMRSPAQMAYVENPNPGRDLFKRFERLLNTQLVKENYYMWLFLTGTLVEERFLPPCLQEKNYPLLRQNLDRIHVYAGDVESLLSSNSARYDKMNLSDIFEYMSDEKAQKLFSLIGSRLNPGGKLAFWNLFVSREPASTLMVTKNSSTLTQRDNVCFYEAFKIAAKSSS